MTRIALITGGNRGLGRASALALAGDDTDVVLTYRSGEDEAAAVVAEVEALGRRAVALQLDAASSEGFADFVQRVRSALRDTWKREDFDILINNAGVGLLTPFGEVDPETLDTLYRVHVRGPILLTDALQGMIADDGRILFVSTGQARFVVHPDYSVYAAAKGAMEVYTRYVAKAVGARGITANIIAPGATATDFGRGAVRDDERLRTMLVASVAEARIGEAEDIGAAVRAVVSRDAGWITAQRIEASGGQSL